MKKSVEEIENEQLFLLWLNEIQKLSLEVDLQIQKKDVSSAIVAYNKLELMRKSLCTTLCGNMQEFLNATCVRWFDVLMETLSKEMTSLLLAIKYPFPTGICSPHFNKKDETEEQFKKTIGLLAQLSHLHYDEKKLTLVIEHLAEPLKKRFYFHFYGDRHTNNPEKPEWYFTQVLNWIKDHSTFLTDYIVPIIEEANSWEEEGAQPSSCLKSQFDEILVDLVSEKLEDTIDVVRGNDVMAAHIIDETIAFEKELKTCVPSSQG